MASKSEELLDGDDIEGIMAVKDNDILAEPNDLETEFAATVFKVPKYRILIQELFSIPKLQKKHIKQKED